MIGSMIARSPVMRNFRTAGVLMIFFGIVSIAMVPKGTVPTVAAYILAGVLCAGGIGLFFNVNALRIVAIGCAGLVALSGVVKLIGHPELSLPGTPFLTIGVSLYLIIRVVLAYVYAKQAAEGSVDDLPD